MGLEGRLGPPREEIRLDLVVSLRVEALLLAVSTTLGVGLLRPNQLSGAEQQVDSAVMHHLI